MHSTFAEMNCSNVVAMFGKSWAERPFVSLPIASWQLAAGCLLTVRHLQIQHRQQVLHLRPASQQIFFNFRFSFSM